jgi:hypothetical protein
VVEAAFDSCRYKCSIYRSDASYLNGKRADDWGSRQMCDKSVETCILLSGFFAKRTWHIKTDGKHGCCIQYNFIMPSNQVNNECNNHSIAGRCRVNRKKSLITNIRIKLTCRETYFYRQASFTNLQQCSYKMNND